MTDFLRRTWAEIDLDALASNFNILRGHLSSGDIMAVVKADAYGHGDRQVALELERLGAVWFGVSNLEEALALRRYGIGRPILVFGYTPPALAETLAANDITQTVFTREYARELHACAAQAGVTLEIHIKVDTGMSRLGFVACEKQAVDDIAAVCAMPGFRAGGIFTHFACADQLEEDSIAYTRMQYHRFVDILLALEDRGVIFPLRHCCNSAGTINCPDMHMDLVRPGIVLYGLLPGPDCAGKLPLQPVMSLRSVVTQVKQISAGTSVSYGRTYTAREHRVVASVAMGYADGLERELSNRARALVRGAYANLIGTVCMDQLMLDVTAIPEVAPGDVVTLVGCDGDNRLTLDEMARLGGTISYERACMVGRRVPRVYKKNGSVVEALDYVRQASQCAPDHA